MSQEAQAAYRNNARSFRSPRATEYDAMARVTSKLKASTEGANADIRNLAKAVYDNRKLWGILAADVAGDGNQLPDDLRAGILSLAAFTNSYSRKILSDSAPVSPLVEINIAVMRGLRNRS